MEIEPKYIQGYWRGKKVEVPEQDFGQVLPALVMAAAALALVAVLLWQTTLALVVSGGSAYLAKRILTNRQKRIETGLRVTYMAEKVKVL